jgi:hypothetical protein
MNKKILLILFLLILIFIIGQRFFILQAEKNVLRIDESMFTLGNNQLDKAIKDYFLSQENFSWKTVDDSRNFCIFENLNSENGLFPFYLWLRCGEFIMEGEEVKGKSGMSGPVKINYPNKLSFYDLQKFSHVFPRDGSLYSEDIKNIFPSNLQERIKNFDRTIINERIKNVARESF